MKKLTLTVLAVLTITNLYVPSVQGQIASEHCSGACSSTATANAQQCWEIIVHDSHQRNRSTGNCGEDSTAPGGMTCGAGSGSRTFYNGTQITWACSSGVCTVVAEIRCNGGSHRIDRNCYAATIPAVEGDYQSVRCTHENGGTIFSCRCQESGVICSYIQ